MLPRSQTSPRIPPPSPTPGRRRAPGWPAPSPGGAAPPRRPCEGASSTCKYLSCRLPVCPRRRNRVQYDLVGRVHTCMPRLLRASIKGRGDGFMHGYFQCNALSSPPPSKGLGARAKGPDLWVRGRYSSLFKLSVFCVPGSTHMRWRRRREPQGFVHRPTSVGSLPPPSPPSGAGGRDGLRLPAGPRRLRLCVVASDRSCAREGLCRAPGTCDPARTGIARACPDRASSSATTWPRSARRRRHALPRAGRSVSTLRHPFVECRALAKGSRYVQVPSTRPIPRRTGRRLGPREARRPAPQGRTATRALRWSASSGRSR